MRLMAAALGVTLARQRLLRDGARGRRVSVAVVAHGFLPVMGRTGPVGGVHADSRRVRLCACARDGMPDTSVSACRGSRGKARAHGKQWLSKQMVGGCSAGIEAA